MHTTPEPSPTITSPGRTRTPPQLTGSLVATTASRERPVSGVMWRANTGKACSIISSRSRTPVSATSPAIPLSLAASVASPPKVDTQCPPLSMTRTSPGLAASMMRPTLKSSEVKSPRRPVTSRTVTARPTQRVPGTIWVRPTSTPSKATSSSALAMVGVARPLNLSRTSSLTLMGPFGGLIGARSTAAGTAGYPPRHRSRIVARTDAQRRHTHACNFPHRLRISLAHRLCPRRPGRGGHLRRSAGERARRSLALRGAGQAEGTRQLARQGTRHADAGRRLRRLQPRTGDVLPVHPRGRAPHLHRHRQPVPGLATGASLPTGVMPQFREAKARQPQGASEQSLDLALVVEADGVGRRHLGQARHGHDLAG